jgi:apolipoprotein N-acyltransferase
MVPLQGFMQSAAIAGIYGPTWMVVLCNTLVAWKLAAPTRGFNRLRIFQILSVLFIVSWMAGLTYLWLLPRHEEASSVEVAVVQANIAFEDDLEPARERFRDFYYPESRKAFEQGAQIVVWPESPTPFSYSLQEDYRRQISQLIPPGRGQLIINDITVEERSKESRYFNSALLLDGQGGLIGRYDKNHLVPYGEYIPLVEYLPLIDALTREVGSFIPGILPGLLDAFGGPVGTFICYEAAFPEIARACTVGGATWLVNLTNDLWYGNTSAPHQHLQIAMVRAIENRRFLVRAANSGFSAVINPEGKVLVASDLFRQEVITGRIFPSAGLSMYARWGDFFPASCVMITCVWMVLGLAYRPFRQKNTAEPLSE